MDWKDIGGTVAKFAPMLGAVIGGPAGGAVGTGVKLLASALGLAEEDATPDKVEQMLRADARAREVSIIKATGKRDVNLYVLAWIVVIGFFALVGILIWATLPQANIGPVNQLFGAMATGFGMVLQYFFGVFEIEQGKDGFISAKSVRKRCDIPTVSLTFESFQNLALRIIYP